MNQKNGQDPEMANIVRRLVEVADPDIKTLSEAEMDAELADSGIDFAAFSGQLTDLIAQAQKKSLLNQARASLQDWRSKAIDAGQGVTRSLEETRREIERHLGGLEGAGHPRALVYFQQYRELPDEDLPDLLRELEMLHDLP